MSTQDSRYSQDLSRAPTSFSLHVELPLMMAIRRLTPRAAAAVPLCFSRHLKQSRAFGTPYPYPLPLPLTCTPYPLPLPLTLTSYPKGLALLALSLSALTSMEVERPALAPGMHTVGWASCTARGVDASGVDMVMVVACAWRHGAQ